MPKIMRWTPERAKEALTQQLKNSQDARRRFESEWEDNERTLYSLDPPHLSSAGAEDSAFDSFGELGERATQRNGYTVNTAFKNFRFIHSQLSANPPSIVPRPTSSDPADRRKADAADRLIKYGMRTYKAQEVFDQASANCLRYGLGAIKTIWDSEAGEILECDEHELIMEGDIRFQVPSTWDLFFDPDAPSWDRVRYVYERMLMPCAEAYYRFPDKKEILDKYKKKEDSSSQDQTQRGFRNKRYDVIEVFQYWETGLPENGMVGRFCYCTKEGELLTDVLPNPFRFPPPFDRGLGLDEDAYEAKKDRIARAYLPYHVFTDNDLPDTIYGRTFISYEAPLQDLHNRMLNSIVDNIEVHGVARIILPEGTEISDDSITSGPLDIIKTTGQRPPTYMEPMQLPAVVEKMLDYVKMGGDDMAGVNESMFGQQSRETSGFSMQYATSQGNMIRRRLFNKYIALVESVWKAYLNLIRKYWKESRTICVLGQEKAFESFDIKGADINGGFDFIPEYGTSFSLDPIERRKELITMLPLFEKAEIDSRTFLRFLKLNEFDGLVDRVQLAYDRQREIFEECIQLQEYVPPRELSDHKNMLAYCYEFVMTAEYKYLPPEIQELIDKHIKEREQLAATGAQPPAPGLPPGPAGAVPPPQSGAAPLMGLPNAG